VNVPSRLVAIYAAVLSGNVAAWIAALGAFHGRPALLATAALAYTLGLRHGIDPDHVAAIDNVTRKLVADKGRPVGVGFYFSLGHSTIVLVLTLAIAISATTTVHAFPALRDLGTRLAPSISAIFLYAIAVLNFIVLLQLLTACRAVRAGGSYDERSLEQFLNSRGLIGRLCRPLMRLISDSRQMYWFGILFGLGFDTATEIGLLGIAAIEGGKGLPIATVLIFPSLFAAGMSVVDTSAGVVALGAYAWAFVRPARKLYYNVTITLLSVLFAIIVGTIELASRGKPLG
jgi:nickel/cobalt transporter (NiCoT) family protein